MVLRSFCLVFMCIISSYLLGSVNFAVLISKRFGSRKDIRELGSKNAGFSNCLRNLGLGPSVVTFLGDFVKGVLSMAATYCVCKKCEYDIDLSVFLVLSQLFCCLGHVFPCFFQFRGGKGILTAWSCIFFINWQIAVILILIFLFSLVLFRLISLSSILCAVSYPLLMFVFDNMQNKLNMTSLMVSSTVSILILIRHYENIKRILDKSEPKINFRGKS